jgi:hypothetical protein
MTLNSTGDVFTGNSLQAPPSGKDSEGSGLSIENNACNISGSLTLDHVLTNVVIAGNSITDGGAASQEHGALYVGCSAGVNGNSLTINDSTISGNAGGGDTAGIWGDPSDTLTLRNSIDTGNRDGVDLTGFAGNGGSVTATNTDLCEGSSPPTGTGNICADPKLADAATGDVHETYPSPTIDAGSNPLVPGGTTKDVYGNPRIQAKLQGHTATVDIGAAEFATIAAPHAKITVPASGALFKLGQVVHTAFTCTEASRGPGIASCKDQGGHPSGAALNTSTAGTHKLTVTAISKDGLKATASVTYKVAAPPKIAIKTPAASAVFTLHQKVHSSFTCTEGLDGTGIASCLDSSGHASGGLINTSTTGRHTFKLIATSRDGLRTVKTVSYTVKRESG